MPPAMEKATSSSLGGTCDEYGFLVAEENVAAYKEHSRLQAERRLICEYFWLVLRRSCASMLPLCCLRQLRNEGFGVIHLLRWTLLNVAIDS
jgi:hypothetical protein